MSSADSIFLTAISNKLDFLKVKNLSDLEDISNGCLFTVLQSFLDPEVKRVIQAGISIYRPRLVSYKNVFYFLLLIYFKTLNIFCYGRGCL